MTIRSLRWSDFPEWVELYFSRFGELEQDPEFGLGGPSTKPSLGDEAVYFGGLQKRILEGDAIVLVAEENGKVVGSVAVERHGNHADERHVGVLGIHIAQGWRRKGIGRALIAAVLEGCRGKFEIVQLTVMSQNQGARHLYEDLGFRETGREPRAIKRGDRYFDRIRMWRPIA